MAVGVGNGTTVTIAGGPSFNLMDVSRSGESVEDIPTSHMATTGTKTYIASTLVEGGELALEVQFDPATSVTVGGDAVNVTIDWGGSGDTESFSGYIKGFDRGAKMGELMTGTLTLKVAGASS